MRSSMSLFYDCLHVLQRNGVFCVGLCLKPTNLHLPHIPSHPIHVFCILSESSPYLLPQTEQISFSSSPKESRCTSNIPYMFRPYFLNLGYFPGAQCPAELNYIYFSSVFLSGSRSCTNSSDVITSPSTRTRVWLLIRGGWVLISRTPRK